MNFDQPPKKEKSVEEKLVVKIKEDVAATYERYPNSVERIVDFQTRLEPLLEGVPDDIADQVRKGLVDCTKIEDEEEFINRVITAVRPVLSAGVFENVEKAARRQFNERGGFTPLNEILSYNLHSNGEVLNLHWAPSRTIPIEQRMQLLLEGMQKLAETVNADSRIKRIQASSWIVAKMPELLTGGGFTVDGEMDPAEKAKHFPNQTEPVYTAHMDREVLLKKYLAK